DSAGATAAGVAAADAVLDPQRADADGADGVQPAVPLVRGDVDERRSVASDGVQQKSRPVAGRRDRRRVFPGGVAPGTPQTAVVGRALHGGWNADRSLGGAEEFPTQR